MVLCVACVGVVFCALLTRLTLLQSANQAHLPLKSPSSRSIKTPALHPLIARLLFCLWGRYSFRPLRKYLVFLSPSDFAFVFVSLFPRITKSPVRHSRLPSLLDLILIFHLGQCILINNQNVNMTDIAKID